MKAGLSTILQTLTPEAAAVLNQSIAEAARRSHGQATPLHVAATLLSSPTGYLRQACIKSHPNSSHPLQGGRALELCFSVALERLPATQNATAGAEPPISNALMAALKRAQAQQRRGCPEQQQQPLLAIKVELEQLIISILDDPSVSRVMREASFSSPAVKATIEQSLLSTSGHGNTPTTVNFNLTNVKSSFSSSGMSSFVPNSAGVGFGFRPAGATPIPIPVPIPGSIPTRNPYVNPRLQKASSGGAGISPGKPHDDEIKRVLDILSRVKKRNPVLIGESEAEQVMKEVVRRVESKEVGDGIWKNVKVCHLDKVAPDKNHLSEAIGKLLHISVGDSGSDSGILISLGDLKWLVEQPSTLVGSNAGSAAGTATDAGRAAVGAVAKLLNKCGESSKLWLIGSATCETYLRCQVHHPTMEHDWDLQALPISTRNSATQTLPRFPGNGLNVNSLEKTFSPLRGFSNFPVVSKVSEKFCSLCKQNYEKEVMDFSTESPNGPDKNQPPLPQWFRKAASQDKTKHEDELIKKQKILKTEKKWHETCVRLHPSHHEVIRPVLSASFLPPQNLLSSQPVVPKIPSIKSLGTSLQLNSSSRIDSPPASPVRTELALGCPKATETSPKKDLTKDFLGVMDDSTPKNDQEDSFLGLGPSKELIHALEGPETKSANSFDVDSVKKILKGLLEAVPSQIEAASSLTSIITQCKMGKGKRRFGGSKSDIWLLFTGPDNVGKRKMAFAVADLVSETTLNTISLSPVIDDEKSETRHRGKTALDQVVDVVRKNPFSVVMLQDIDKADLLVRQSIKRAMERGRISDSYGREVSLGNVIFILTANWLPESFELPTNCMSLDKKKIACLEKGEWQLRLSLCEKSAKRHAGWLLADRPIKHKKDSGSGFSFDLNEAADIKDDRAEGSVNSSDLTVEYEEEHPFISTKLRSYEAAPFSRDLLNHVDGNVVFKPVEFDSLRSEISGAITRKLATMIGESISVEIQEEALERIVCGVWLGWMELEEWSNRALVPIIRRLKLRLPCNIETLVVRLETANDSIEWRQGDDAEARSIRVSGCGF